MNMQRLKKSVAGMVIALSLAIGSGIVLPSTAQAQDWRWQRDRREAERDWYRRRQIERAREMERAREIQRAREWERSRNRNIYRNPNYGNYGRYGGYSSAEEQRGFRNGLKEGGDDARDRDSFNPSRHSSFRDGNEAYRQGFYRGYEQSYRQYAGYRRR